MTAALSLLSPPSFANLAGPRERRIPRVLVTLAGGLAAGAVAALAAGLLVSAVSAKILADHSGVGWLEAMKILGESARPGRSLGGYVYELAVAGLSSLAAAFAFLSVAAHLARRPVRSFLTAAPRFRWSQALVGLAVFLPVVGLELWIERLGDAAPQVAPILAPGAALGERLAYAAAALVFLWMAAFAEEALFRGWVLQQTSALTRNLAAVILLNAAIFAVAHGDLAPGPLAARFAMGAGWAFIVLRLGGVEFASGAHLANNLGIALFARPAVFAVPRPEPVHWASLGLQVGSVAVLAVAVELFLRRRRSGF